MNTTGILERQRVLSFDRTAALKDHVVKQLAQYGNDAIQFAFEATQPADIVLSAVAGYCWIVGLLFGSPLLWFPRWEKWRRTYRQQQMNTYAAVDLKLT